MSYGLICNGNSGQVLIDQDRNCLRMIVSGTYSRASNGTVSVSYPSPVRSQSAPVVFVCPDGAGMFWGFNHVGSPGNWTGFNCILNTTMPGMSGVATTGKYAACAIDHPQSSAEYGAVVRDASGAVVFETGYRAARFVGGAQVFPAYDNQPGGSLGGVLFRHRLPWEFGLGRFLMISGFRNYYDNVNLSDIPSIGFYSSAKDFVWANIHSLDTYPPGTLNWPMVAADFG